jgi:hypothetical protein
LWTYITINFSKEADAFTALSEIPANEIVIGWKHLYTQRSFYAEIVAELGLGTTTYLPENFNGMVYHLPQINHTYTLLSTPPAVKAILVGPAGSNCTSYTSRFRVFIISS